MNLFDKIENLLALMPHGWCSVRKAQTLAALIAATRPKVVVEIGVYAGRSFLPMVQALHHVAQEGGPVGRAVGIDPYDARASAAGENTANAAWWGGLDHKAIKAALYEILDATGHHFAPHWELIEKRSDEVQPRELSADSSFGVLHVDGSHTDQAVRDVQRFARHVRVGGFVVLDDLLWESKDVSKCADWLTEHGGFVECFRVIGEEPGTGFTDNWGVFQRVTV